MPSLRTLVRPAVLQGLMLRERLESGVAWNPLERSFQVDPVPTYRKLLAKDPVHRSRIAAGQLVFSRHADVDAILRDHRRFGSDARKREDYVPTPYRDEDRISMLGLDPPDHTRLRALVSKAFTPRAIAAMRPRIESVVDGLLDDVRDARTFDVIETLAYPLPVIVIAEMLGVPPEDRERFKAWSNAVARILEPNITPEEGARVRVATEELDAYFTGIIEQRRAEPREDIISALIAAEDAGDTLTHTETLTMLRLLLVAGNETTTNLIGNGLLALLRNPDEYDRLRADPSLLENGIEELLRYDSPVQLDGRTALDTVEVGGVTVARGRGVVLLLGAANHDPAAFPDPDRLDVTRENAKNHVSFGRGIHHCLGAPLARMEGRMAFERLLDRYPRLRYAGPPTPDFRPNVTLRGLRSLPVEAVPATTSASPVAAAG